MNENADAAGCVVQMNRTTGYSLCIDIYIGFTLLSYNLPIVWTLLYCPTIDAIVAVFALCSHPDMLLVS